MANADRSAEQFRKMTETPIPKLILSLAAPTILSMLITSIYNLADTFFVGQISTSASGAVGIVSSLMAILQALGFMLGHGSGSIISRSLGSQNTDAATRFASTSFFTALVFGGIITTAGLLTLPDFMMLLGSTETILPHACAYARYILLAAPIMMSSLVMNNILRYEGKASFAMIGLVTGGLLNIALDPLFIFGLGMGVKGAAIATVCGQCIAGTLAMIFNIKKNPDLHITLRRFRPHGEIIGKILSVGVPSVIMVAIGSVMNYFLNLILYSFSKLAVAVFGAYFKVQSMAFMPVFGLNNGMIPIISYNYGAQKPDRMKRTMKLGVMVGCSIMVFCLAIMQVFPGQILKIFDATDEMLLMGIPAVRIMSTAFIFAGFSVTCSGMFQAVGKGVYSMIVSMARQLFVILPVAYFLSKAMNSVNGVWAAFPIAEVFSVIISTIFLLRVYKKIVKPMESV